MSRQLYEEVLADARQLKQVAEDNAKRALIEAVTPRIRDLIEQQLMGGSSLGDDEEMEEPEDEMGGAEVRSGKNPDELESGDEILTDHENAEPDGDEVAIDVTAMMAPEETACAPSVAPLSGQAAPANFAAPVATGQNPVAQTPAALVKGKNGNTPPAVPAAPPAIMPPPVLGSAVDTTQMPSEEEEYELNLESLDILVPMISASGTHDFSRAQRRIKKLVETTRLLGVAGDKIRKTSGYQQQILKTITNVENMYDYVQEMVTVPANNKKLLESNLERIYGDLNKLRESKMAKNKKINEGDVTLKLTGMPEDLNLDEIGVDLIQDDETVAVGGDADGDADDLGLDAAPDMGTEPGAAPDELAAEGVNMDENTIVEIDESMLRREIARMKKMNEEFKVPSNAGAGVDADVMHSFGGGKDDGDAWEDHDVTTADNLKETDEPMEEADMPMGEEDEPMAEGDEPLEEMQLKRNEETYGSGPANSHSVAVESVSKKLAFEGRLQKRITEKLASIKSAAKAAHAKGATKKVNECKAAWKTGVARMNESKARVSGLRKQLAESKNAVRSNIGAERSAERTTVESLRTQLADMNLFNAKLLHTNKLLQNESLSDRQKAQIIERLDDVQSLREVKLVYESLVKTLGGASAKPVNEGASRQVMGSGSRPTRSASSSATLNESNEAARWATLAGIK